MARHKHIKKKVISDTDSSQRAHGILFLPRTHLKHQMQDTNPIMQNAITHKQYCVYPFLRRNCDIYNTRETFGDRSP